MENVIKGKEWNEYLHRHELGNQNQEDIYVASHNHTAIYRIGEYYFSFSKRNGYKNLSSLKRLL